MMNLSFHRIGPGAGCLCLAALILPLLTGCNAVRFYSQAARGQFQIVHRQEPVSKLLANPETPPELAGRLQRILAIREFAERELRLPANGHYLSYADLGRRFAVWNVYAAPEFSMNAKSWWYPIVGRLKYQGYFSELGARRYATNLAGRGYDVFVGGVQAYSTLGWFRDPVLNTFAFDDDRDLAELLFHELTHQRLFIPGDTDFNEALATTVAEEGVRRWIRMQGDNDALARFNFDLRRKEEFIHLLQQTRDRLQNIYTNQPSAGNPSLDELRRAKVETFSDLRTQYDRLKASWNGAADYDGWFNHPINNARLNTIETYYRFLPAFRHLLSLNEGDLDRFFQQVEAMSDLGQDDRRRRMNELLVESAIVASAPGNGEAAPTR